MHDLKQNTMINSLIEISKWEFDRLGSFIMSQYGIKMPASKRIFLQCRLQKRLKDLNIDNFGDYSEFLFSPQGLEVEMPMMIDAISTNTTDFFRESHHFDFLLTQGLDQYCNRTGTGISAWSAGCATGEEPYTLAMIMKEYSGKKHIEFDIMATDISQSVLLHAAMGIYSEDKIQSIPEAYRKKYLMKGLGSYANKVRISSEIREKISFRSFNLKGNDFKSLHQFDIIFCRNVLIYFERNVQEEVLRNLCDKLLPKGYLFLGHSESIAGMDLPLIPIRPTVFQKVAR